MRHIDAQGAGPSLVARRPEPFALIAVFVLCVAQTAVADTPFAGEFLTLGVGGRPLAMGGGYAALASDATAAQWNPAGLGQLTRTEAAFMHSTLHGLDAYDYIGVARPFGSDVWSASWLRVGIDDIILTRVPNPSNPVSSANRPTVHGVASMTNNAFTLGWGHRLYGPNGNARRGELFAGASAKFLLLTAPGGGNAFGLGSDVGLLGTFRLRQGTQLRGAAVVQDFFNTTLYWNTVPSEGVSSQRDTIGRNFRMAIGVVKNVPPGDSRLTVSVETDSRFDFEMHYGAEWALGDLLALRAGVVERKSDADTLRDVTMGAGFRLGFMGGEAFLVDYAFGGGELGNSHRVSLGAQF